MIDRDEMRIARRTVERNGYTVIPPREKDEEDLNRFRDRRSSRDVVRQRPRFRDDDDDLDNRAVRKPVRKWDDDTEPVRKWKDDTERRPSRTWDNDDDDVVLKTPKFKPLRTRPVEDDDDDDFEPRQRVRVPERKPLSDLERAKRTAELNGYSVRKMSRLDQAKQVAQDAGYSVRKAPIETSDDDDDVDDRVISRPRRVATRDGIPFRKPIMNRDAIRTRTAPDVEIKPKETKPVEPEKTTPVETQPEKKPSFADDYINRAAAFFGDDD